MIIPIIVKEKHALNVQESTIVCGNSDYQIEFTFDSEWDAEPMKTARFFYRKADQVLHQDKVFVGTTVDVPLMFDTFEVCVSVFAGDLRTTTLARIFCERGGRCGESVPDDPLPNQYDEIMRLINQLPEALYAAENAKNAADTAVTAKETAVQSADSAKKSAADAASTLGKAVETIDTAKQTAVSDVQGAGDSQVARIERAGADEVDALKKSVAADKAAAAASAEAAGTSERNAALSANRAEQVATANGFAEFYMENGRTYLVRTANIVDNVDFEQINGRLVVKING